MNFDEDIMWNAVIESNSNYDGVFYYAVKTTRIFCRPSCKSKAPLRDNIYFFNSTEEAIKEGFRPCKRCQPDLFNKINEEIISEKLNKILESEYSNSNILNELHTRVGFSKSHMQRLYKSETGNTPRKYLQKIRINRAKELLREGKLSNAEICYEIGFKSMSSFYETFKYYEGITPGEFDKR